MAMNKTDQGHDKGQQQGNPGNQGDKANRPDDQRKQQNQNPNQGGQQFNQGRPGDRSDKGGDRGNQPNR
jgi:hypothetical protein